MRFTKKVWLLGGLVAVFAMAFAWPYLGIVIFRLVGTNTAIMYEADGSAHSLVMGPDAPLPEWLPKMPGALTLEAAYWIPDALMGPAGGHDIIVHASPEAIENFYAGKLAAAGFAITKTPNRPEFGLLGIAGGLQGRRESDNLEIGIFIRTRESVISPARAVQISWTTRKAVAASN